MTVPVPVHVSATSEWPALGARRGVVVEARVDFLGDRMVVLGVAERTADGWVSVTRAGIIRRRFIRCDSSGAVQAVAVILRARQARWAGVNALSRVHWSDDAARAARDAWGAGVPA